MDQRRFTDDLVNPQPRIQAGVRILKNHLYLQPRIVLAARAQAVAILTINQHLPRRRRQQTADDTSQRRFAATGFAYQADYLAGHDMQIDGIQSLSHRGGPHPAARLQHGFKRARLAFAESLANEPGFYQWRLFIHNAAPRWLPAPDGNSATDDR